jgi:hypothetical protein
MVRNVQAGQLKINYPVLALSYQVTTSPSIDPSSNTNNTNNNNNIPSNNNATPDTPTNSTNNNSTTPFNTATSSTVPNQKSSGGLLAAAIVLYCLAFIVIVVGIFLYVRYRRNRAISAASDSHEPLPDKSFDTESNHKSQKDYRKKGNDKMIELNEIKKKH